ncbi:TetR/AcrR family transcriptional regulator [Nocardioides plantarum]|uniref:TetR/AcrR family transcriptional regulator n=1 Tax=Nocardioides plantarum TaxID=29299 RepID=A0ABV5KGC5_9ACTN|nr:TetR/AcrR family transcriptional regulator [Nocardioides plantarum]
MVDGAAPPAPSVPAAPRRGRPPRTSQAELVTAAMTVIGRDGVGAATTRKIADEAGVPLGTVHYWFKDKAGLLDAVVRELLRRIETVTEALALSDETDYREALLATFRSIAEDDLGTQLGTYELTVLAVRTPGMRELAARQYQLYRATARHVVELALADSDLDPATVATLGELVAVTFDGMVLAWLADPDGADPEGVLAMLAHLLQLARTSGGPAA